MKRIAVCVLCCLLAAGCLKQASPVREKAENGTIRDIERKDYPGLRADLAPSAPPADGPDAGSKSSPPAPASPAAESGASAAPPEPPASKDGAPAAPEPKPAAGRKPKDKPAPSPKSPAVSARQSQQSGKRLSLSELRSKYPESFKVSGAAKEKKIALTFDDGPDRRFTPQVLDVLKRHGVKATFFLLGRKAEEYPDVVQRMVSEGHAIGNHSYRHPLFTKMTVDQFAAEIERTEDVLNGLIGYRPKMMRPPYGAINEGQLQWAKSRGLVVVNWNVDSLDWKSLGEEQVSRNILGHTKAGSIVLQHSSGGDTQDLSGTVKALPGIIATLRSQGYELVTVPELLRLPKSK